MTLYRVMVGQKEYKVDVSSGQLSVNGEKIQADLTPINADGLYMLLNGDRRRNLHVDSRGNSAYTVTSRGKHVVARVENGANLFNRRADTSSSNDLLAPMPGMVIQVLVKEGDAVQKGQVVVVLESMKMQMEMRAPQDGTVAKVAVQPHSTVEKGSLLLRLG
jgi:biotin carboxyl carrier protein